MKSRFLSLFRKNKKETPPKQVVFKRPSRVALEDAVKHYVDWRFPGAGYCHERKGPNWIMTSFIYNPVINCMETKFELSHDYDQVLMVHLVGNVFVC